MTSQHSLQTMMTTPYSPFINISLGYIETAVKSEWLRFIGKWFILSLDGPDNTLCFVAGNWVRTETQSTLSVHENNYTHEIDVYICNLSLSYIDKANVNLQRCIIYILIWL